MGACVVYDGMPHTIWPEPLIPGEQYLDGGCAVGADYSLPDTSRYELLRERIETLLAEPERMHRLRSAASTYFDNHLTPSAIGSYLLGRVSANLGRTYPQVLPTVAPPDSGCPGLVVVFRALAFTSDSQSPS